MALVFPQPSLCIYIPGKPSPLSLHPDLPGGMPSPPPPSPSPTPSDDAPSERDTQQQDDDGPLLTSSALEQRLHLLRQAEKRIEQQTARQGARLRDLRSTPTPRVLRVRVKTVHEVGEASSFDLRVEGEVLPNPLSPEARPPKMSTLLKKVCVHLDKEQFGDRSVVVWSPSNFLTEFNGFQVKRDAERGFEAKIELHFHDRLLPPKARPVPASSTQLGLSTRYRVGKLQPIVEAPTATLAEILAQLWEYINAQRLRERESNVVQNDARLTEIFGVREMRMHELRARVLDLLDKTDARQDEKSKDPGLVTIPYRICLRAAEAEEFAYDIEVPIADRVSAAVSDRLDAAAGPSTAHALELAQLDEQLAAVQTSLAEAKRKRDLACRVMMEPQHMLSDQLASANIRDQQVLSALSASADEFALLSSTGKWLTPSAEGKKLYDSMGLASAKRAKYWCVPTKIATFSSIMLHRSYTDKASVSNKVSYRGAFRRKQGRELGE